jgi:hypothetical protein
MEGMQEVVGLLSDKLTLVAAGIVFISLFAVLPIGAGAYQLSASASKIVYLQNQTLAVSGQIGTNSSMNVTFTVYNTTGIAVASLQNESAAGYFYAYYLLNETIPGTYTIVLTDPQSSSISVNFSVAAELTYFKTFLINQSNGIVAVNTSTLVTEWNTTGGNSNFTELVNLSVSKVLHYGNFSFPGSEKEYHLVLVDENSNLTYDRIYIDDDKVFQFYNDTEDSNSSMLPEKVLKPGDKFGNFTIGFVEFEGGSTVLLIMPPDRPDFTGQQTVNYVVVATDQNGDIQDDKQINVAMINSTGGTLNSSNLSSNSFGYAMGNFTTSNATGQYFINFNQTLGVEPFSVESFKFMGKVTDLSNNPSYGFTPDSIIRIRVVAKTMAGSPQNLTTATAMVTHPSGSSASYTLSYVEDGVYSYDVDMAGASNGAYVVKITGSDGTNTQTMMTGFEIAAVGMEIEAVNLQFMDQMQKGGVVSAFYPGRNITIAVFQSNISAGGMMAEGPEGMAVIPIESGTFTCAQAVTVLEINDERGTALNMSAISMWIMNISDAIAATGVTLPEDMGPAFMKQCMVMFTAPAKTGDYEIKLQLNTSLGTDKNTETFSVQKVMATGSTVDFRGEDFKFLAPNSSIIIKIKLQELENRTELPGSNITSIKIIGMERVFPTYSDVFSDSAYKALVNESIVTTGDGSGKGIQFISPEGEGFHIMKFKFKAMIGNEIVEGMGTAEFMLKKYMIWAEPKCENNMGWCMFGSGQTIQLTVYVMDIDKGSMMTMMGKDNMGSAMSCTGCEGLVVDVQNLFNDQVMKQMTNATDYSVAQGMIIGNNATINISPVNLLSGWYGMDLTLTDPTDISKQYFGWGGFEIRTLMVNMMPLAEAGSDLLMPEGGGGKGGSASPIGSHLLFGIQAFDPGNMMGGPLNVSSAAFKSAKWMISWPPPEVSGVSASSSSRLVNTSMCPPPYQPPCAYNMTVVNVTGMPAQAGQYQITFDVTTTDSRTDLGTSWTTLASYNSAAAYRGMDQWPVIFSASEVIEFNVSATEFAGGIHNMSNVTIKSIFEDKGGMPIRVNHSLYNNSCDNDAGLCQVHFKMSDFGCSQQNRMYQIEFQLNDTLGQTSSTRMEFQTRGYTIGVPSITEMWLDNTETATRELDVPNDRDNCNNMLGMPNDMCQSTPGMICTENGVNITFPQKNETQTYSAARFELSTQGQWMQGGPSGTTYVISNGSALWIKQQSISACNMTDIGFNLTGHRFNVTHYDSNNTPYSWIFNITSIDGGQFQIDVPGKVCGRAWGHGGDVGFTMEIPATYSTMYFGKVNNLISQLENNQDQWFMQMFAPFVASRPVYIFHNTTDVWMTNSTNMSTVSAAAIGGTLSDPYGGNWTVMSINTNKVTLKGQNVLASTGAWINTSLTKSGYIKYSVIREQEFGRWDRENNQQKGTDLDGDGYNNGTIYVMISDSQTAGVYDTFFINSTNVFSRAMSVNENNMTFRTFGSGDSALTLLSIDPRADKILLYSPQAGDWSDLGDGMVGSNARVPIIVRTPAGESPGVVNVSIETIRFNSDNFKAVYQIDPASAPRTLINISDNGIGEVLITNASSYSGGRSGEYVYGLKIEITGSSELLDEWRWPRKTLRNFLADSERGRGGYINNFVPLPLTKYSWEKYGDVSEEIVSSVNISNVWNDTLIVEGETMRGPDETYQGAMITACLYGQPCNTQSVEDPALAGCQFQPPTGAAATGTNVTFMTSNLKRPIYIFMNSNNESMFWIKESNCNFSTSLNQTNGSQVLINITEPGKVSKQFRTRVLYVNSTLYAVVIGYGQLPAGMLANPLVSRGDQNIWKVMSLQLGVERYDIALAGDNSWNHTLCAAWNLQECAKKAWFSDPTGNLSNATGVTIGESINSEMYLANIGPGPWEGITVGNMSNLPAGLSPPNVGLWLSDNTTSYFANTTELASGVDFNLNGQNNDTTPWYILTFDGNPDGINTRNSVLVDDDIKLTEDWWNSNMQGGTPDQAISAYYEFDASANESGVPESRNSLPSAIWSGQLCFNKTACDMQGGDWQVQMRKPQWDILYYNGSSMLIRKWSENINQGENVTLMVRVYNQTQDPLAANVTVEKIIRGCQPMPANTYSATSVITDTGMNGYGIITLSPVDGPWQNGEYMVTLRIASEADPSKVERTQEWFRVGNFFQPM